MNGVWKYVSAMVRWWLPGLITRKPVEWGATREGEPDYTEPWSWELWSALRPHYYGLMKRLPCGCSRRFGRIVLYSMDCKKHGMAYGTEEEES